MRITESYLKMFIRQEIRALQEEGGADQNVEMIGSMVHQHGFMNLRDPLSQLGFKVDFVIEPLAMYMLEKDGVKYAVLKNGPHVEDPDLVVGETAIGKMS